MLEILALIIHTALDYFFTFKLNTKEEDKKEPPYRWLFLFTVYLKYIECY